MSGTDPGLAKRRTKRWPFHTDEVTGDPLAVVDLDAILGEVRRIEPVSRHRVGDGQAPE